MKTNQIMTRNLGGFEIQQRTQDGFFDGNALLQKWNAQIGLPSAKRREMKKFLNAKNTKEFLEALAADEQKREFRISQNFDKADLQLVIESKGRYSQNGRTPDRVWMHPLLFIKFAMWLNPTFEVQVLRFVADQMLEFRDEAAEAYKQLSRAVSSLVEKNKIRESMQKVAEALNWVVFGSHEKMMRNKQGEEDKMRELFELERKVAELVEEGFIQHFDVLVEYLRNQWRKKNTPRVFAIKTA